MDPKFEVRMVVGEAPWVCFKCHHEVRYFIVENLMTKEEHLEAFLVEDDEDMIDLRETIGIEKEPASVANACKHNRIFKRFCNQWRAHKNRISRISKIIDNRLMDIDHCLGEWGKISRQLELVKHDPEKRSNMLVTVKNFQKNFHGMLNDDGPGEDENFKKEMRLMRSELDYLMAGIPEIKVGIVKLSPNYQEHMLQIIKKQSDKFEAKHIETRPGEWTVTNFYNELKAACDEENAKKAVVDLAAPAGVEDLAAPAVEEDLAASGVVEESAAPADVEMDRPQTSAEPIVHLPSGEQAKLLLPPGFRFVLDTSSSSAVSDSDTLFVDIACLLKLFSTVNSVPRTFYERPKAPPPSMADPPVVAMDVDASTSSKTIQELRANQIAKIDSHIRKLERSRNKIVKSITKIKKTLGDIIVTESETVDEFSSTSESDQEIAEDSNDELD